MLNLEIIMYSLLLLMLLLNCTGCFLVQNGKRSVHAPVGEIDQRTVRNFLGIPYAEPPVNGSRYQKPVPKAVFSSPFDGSSYGAACIQYMPIFTPLRIV